MEQKSIGVDLDAPEMRQGKLKTPLEQALDYVDELRPSEQPRFVITCNFGTFRVYDREKWSRSQLAGKQVEFSLAELGKLSCVKIVDKETPDSQAASTTPSPGGASLSSGSRGAALSKRPRG